METEDLIRLVHDRRCLWDRSMTSYRDKVMKDKAWAEIYREIEPEYDTFSEEMKNLIGLQITKKWYNVRDSYVKSRKSISQRHRPYLHSKLLSFLEPIYFRKTSDNSREERSENEDIEEQWLNVIVDEDEEHEAKRPKIDLTLDKSKDNSKVEEEHVVNVLTNLISGEDDEDRAFFRSIMPSVKKLSEESKLEFRIQLMNLLKVLLNKDRHIDSMSFKYEIVDGSDTD